MNNRAVGNSILHRHLRHRHLRQVPGATQVGEEDGIIPGDRRATLLIRLLRRHQRLPQPIHQLRAMLTIRVILMMNTTVSVVCNKYLYLVLSFSAAEHDHWIFRYRQEDKRGIVVTISNGPDGIRDRYDGGEFDGARGAIVALQDPGKLDRAFVYIKLLDNEATRLNVPVKFVNPTPPGKKGEKVILLEDQPGFKAGTVCIVSGPPSEGMTSLMSEGGPMRVNTFSLCLYQSP